MRGADVLVRITRMNAETICQNRRTLLGFIASGRYNAEQNASDQSDADLFATGMRMHWTDAMTPATWKQRFGVALHLCRFCSDIPGAPVALGSPADGFDSNGKRLHD